MNRLGRACQQQEPFLRYMVHQSVISDLIDINLLFESVIAGPHKGRARDSVYKLEPEHNFP